MKKLVLLYLVIFSTTLLAQKHSKKDYLITINTEYGEMIAILYDETPLHKKNFIHLADSGFYNGTLFHRIIPDFMIQGGDPKSKNAEPGAMLGNGDVGYTIPAEFNEKLFHKKGALAAARDNNPQKASSGCQFYIVEGKVFSDDELQMALMRAARKPTEEQKQVYKTIGGTPHLDGNYTVFGEIVKGLEVIESISKQQRDGNNRPAKDIRMTVTVKKNEEKEDYENVWIRVLIE